MFANVDGKLVRGRPRSFDDQNICVQYWTVCTWNMDCEVQREDI